MFIFWRLLLAHFVADFPLQLDSIYRLKTKYVWGSFVHSGVFILLAALFLWPLWAVVDFWLFLVFLFISHGLQDFSKILYTRKNNRDTVWFFLFDQFLHIVFISVVLWFPFSVRNFAVAKSSLLYLYFQDGVIMYLVFAVAVGFGGSIFIPYVEKLVQRQEAVEIPPKYKYFGVFERILVVSLVASPGYYFFFTPVVFLIRYFSREKYSRISIIVSIAVAAVFGLALRFSL